MYIFFTETINSQSMNKIQDHDLAHLTWNVPLSFLKFLKHFFFDYILEKNPKIKSNQSKYEHCTKNVNNTCVYVSARLRILLIL